MTKRSTLMIHQAGMSTEGHENDLLDGAEWLRSRTAALFEHYAHRIPGLKIEELLTRTAGGRCIWLDWQQAKRLGAIDAVVDSVTDVK